MAILEKLKNLLRDELRRADQCPQGKESMWICMDAYCREQYEAWCDSDKSEKRSLVSDKVVERLMRKYELKKFLSSEFKLSKKGVLIRGSELSTDQYCRLALVFVLYGTINRDVRFYNVALKLIDSKCSNRDNMSKAVLSAIEGVVNI